jgi:hypothetical protein
MKLFKKIAKAAGAAAKKDKPPDAAGAKKEEPAAPDTVPGTSGKVPGEATQAVKDRNEEKDVGKHTEGTGQGGLVSADDESSMRATYEALSKESEDLKQRNRFLLQMLAVSQLDEAHLEKEIKEKKKGCGIMSSPGLRQTSIVSSPGGATCRESPVYKRI